MMNNKLKGILPGLPILLLLTIALCSCDSKPDSKNRIVTGNNEVIKIATGEKVIRSSDAGKLTNDKYKKYFNSVTNYRAPLNKIFSSPACTFFYGIPLNNNVALLYNNFIDSYGTRKIIASIAADTSEAKIMAKDSLTYILVEIIRTPRNNFLLAGAVSRDSALIMEYYQSNNLRTRITDEKQSDH